MSVRRDRSARIAGLKARADDAAVRTAADLRLDRTLEDSFPASDPASANRFD